MHLHRLPGRPLTLALVSLVVAIGVTGCQAAAGPDAADRGLAEVAAVIDASTLEVLQGATPITVRLLGVVPPVAKECLSTESASTLAELLPVGTEIRLDREDDSTPAAVYAEGVLINAELVRRGLAFVAADEAGSILEAVGEAEKEAVRAEAGLFGAETECTIPAQVAALETAESAAAEAAAALAAGVGLDEIDRHSSALATIAATGAALAALLDGDSADRLPASLVAVLSDRTAAVNDRLVTATAGVEQRRAEAEQRIEAERVEAERIAAEAAAQAAAEEAARVAREAAEAEAARAAAAALEEKARTAPAVTGGSVYYQNCDAVRAAGAAPIYEGQPGYSTKLDRDRDGVGCEN